MRSRDPNPQRTGHFAVERNHRWPGFCKQTSVTRCIGKPSQTVLSCSFKDHLCFCEHVAHFHRAGFPQAKSSTCRITAETLPPWTSTVAHQQKPAWGLAASLQRPWGWFFICFFGSLLFSEISKEGRCELLPVIVLKCLSRLISVLFVCFDLVCFCFFKTGFLYVVFVPVLELTL